MTAASSDEVVVCALADLAPGERCEARGALTYGVTVFNLDGDLYALLNHCPHRGGPLCRGRMRPHPVSDQVGRWDFEREGEILRCPFHNWEFDIRTGRALYDERVRARMFPVEVRDGNVVVRVRARRPAASR